MITIKFGKHILPVEIEKIKDQLKKEEKVAVAYSGGVDSTLVSYLCKTSGIDYVTVTVVSEVLSRDELENAVKIAEVLNLNHEVIRVNLLNSRNFIRNDAKRCYYCKKKILEAIKDFAGDRKIVDGTNADDLKEFRPGMRATEEMNVVSPLKKLGKEEIRRISKRLGLPTWNKPPNSCLATRIIKENISYEKLRRIERAEEIVKQLGFRLVRVRAKGNEAIVQVARNRVSDLLKIKEDVSSKLNKLGFQRVFFDPEGYHYEETV
ncbi:MAG TPA: ATP-dependent sacrificial sulfur transferase LarE [Archaeoglobaceae archaeon]|nr:ATP-dependent sacrificial sulfur transferase LarE [Archaeoglobaceae archaeon]